MPTAASCCCSNRRRLSVEAEARLGQTANRRTALDTFSAISRRAVDLALRSPDPVVIQDAAAADAAGEVYMPGERRGFDAGHGHRAAGPHDRRALSREPRIARRLHREPGRDDPRARRAGGIALENARLYGRVQTALETQTALAEANRRFVPDEFLSGPGRESIVDVKLNEAVEREMNVLFVDLRSFSALTAQLRSEPHHRHDQSLYIACLARHRRTWAIRRPVLRGRHARPVPEGPR